MSEIELPELPELEKEERRDKLNTLVAITVTLLVTFMAMCKIKDNNTVLHMQEAQTNKVDDWERYQALSVHEDLALSKIGDLRDAFPFDTNAEHKKAAEGRISDYEALEKKILEKKEKAKTNAETEEKNYDSLNEVHEKFDHCEGAVSIAVSLLAMTSLLQKRWMYAISLIPTIIGVVMGVLGLLAS